MPGDDLGTFAIQAGLTETTCGPGAFGAPERWDFSIKLSQEDGILYWNNGSETVPAETTGDGTYVFSSETTVPVRAAAGARRGCSMVRKDHATCHLTGETNFDGDLSYSYSAGLESDCSEDVLELGILALPCSIIYDFKGVPSPQ